MNNELWPVGTWVAIKRSGYAMCLSLSGESSLLSPFSEKINAHYVCSKAPYAELPPLPDEEALRKQGYRLTGMAADCSKNIQCITYVMLGGHNVVVGNTGSVCSSEYNGWRLLVERIDTDEEQHSDSEEAFLSSTGDDEDERETWEEETLRYLNEGDGAEAIKMFRQKHHMVNRFVCNQCGAMSRARGPKCLECGSTDIGVRIVIEHKGE